MTKELHFSEQSWAHEEREVRQPEVRPSSADSKYARLPCPFCGHEPYAAMDMKGAIIQCQNPDCFGPRTTAAYLVDAVQQWNKRASITDPAQQPPKRLTSDQIMGVLRKVVAPQLREQLTCKRWKDGIDIDEPTFVAERLAEEFIALAAQPPAAPVETPTIDDVPSCGQENDYRRAKPAAPVEPFDVMATIDPNYAESFERGADLPTHNDVRGILPRSSAGTAQPPQPIETAPKDGSHILAWRIPIGIRVTNNTHPPTVVHWFDDPDEPGFYTSVNELAPQHPFNPTHWTHLPEGPR